MRAVLRLLFVLLCLLAAAIADEVEYQGWLGRWWDVRATAYSPQDQIDQAYRDSKGPRWRNITADGFTDVRRVPYGIAVPGYVTTGPLLRYGTRVVIPAGQGYLDQTRPDDRVFPVDDTGSAITERTESEGLVYVDLRFRTTRSARAWAGPQGWRALRLFVIRCRAPAVAVDLDAATAGALGPGGADEIRRAMQEAVSHAPALTSISTSPTGPTAEPPSVRVSPHTSQVDPAVEVTYPMWVLITLLVGMTALIYMVIRGMHTAIRIVWPWIYASLK